MIPNEPKAINHFKACIYKTKTKHKKTKHLWEYNVPNPIKYFHASHSGCRKKYRLNVKRIKHRIEQDRQIKKSLNLNF